MTKEARTAKPVRATSTEWDEITRAAKTAGMSVNAYVLDAALKLARGEVRPPASKPAVAKPTATSSASKAGLSPRFNQVTSLRDFTPLKPLPPRK